MERPTASLTYKGSISEAIIEAQNQKKIFLVYISGADENSTNLENSTWVDLKVVEVLSRYCIFLHLIEGHIEALQFSSIYPQKSIPSISAITYNGVMLWQHEGDITAESFIECIEKSWAAMHFQDTAAVILTAALAPKKPGPSSAGNSNVGQSEQVGYPNPHDPSSSSADYSHDADGSSDPKAMVEEIGNDDNVAMQLDRSIAVSREDTEILDSKEPEILPSVAQNMQISEITSHERLPEEAHCSSSPKSGSPQINANEVHEGIGAAPGEDMDRKSSKNSTDVFLGIRMPSGISLQAKFTITDTLRLVKDYVDHNQGNVQGLYDLAIPYPRTIFAEEDMSKTLAELGIAGRQAIIVIPRQGQRPLRGLSSPDYAHPPATQANSATGFFGYLKRVLSYVNPFSYLAPVGGDVSSGSEQAQNADSSQRGTNPGLHSSLSRETERRPYSSNPQNSPPSSGSSNSSRPSRPFGGNIHTLRYNESDLPSGDRNTFWNGNSTQYGGNDE